MSYLTIFSTICRTRRNVASTKSRMRPIVVSAKWFSTNCRAPLNGDLFIFCYPWKHTTNILKNFMKLSIQKVAPPTHTCTPLPHPVDLDIFLGISPRSYFNINGWHLRMTINNKQSMLNTLLQVI